MGIYDRDYQREAYGERPYGGQTEWSMTTWLIVINVAVFVLQIVTADRATDWLALHEDWFYSPWEIYTFLTYGFTHGDPLHIAGNMIGLFFFGRAIEVAYGRREMLAFYLASILFSAAVWNLTELAIPNPPGVDPPSLIGASGGVVAIVILFALKYPHQSVYLLGIVEIPAWLLGLFIVGSDAYHALSGTSGMVAVTAHLGGALFAFLYLRYRWRLAPYLPYAWNLQQVKSRVFGPRLRVHHPSTDDDRPNQLERELDRILQKIQEQGQDSLTAKERKTLEQASRSYQQRPR